jgi:adenylate cyclase class 2
MRYEVEQKFLVARLSPLEGKLAELGATVSEALEEVDRYFAHPARDFAATDEALRIRRQGQSASIAYKGPKVDPTTKTRREIELPLSPQEDAAAGWEDLLSALGFTPVGDVRKRRRKATVWWEGRQVLVSLDEVDELGAFVELELIAGADQIEPAKTCIASLADALGLADGERRSYLELLLERRGRGKGSGQSFHPA